MAKVMVEDDARFVINLGDNFYFNGVTGLKDSRFWRSFEDPYKEIKIPWYVIAGNHDHLGNVSAEIEHTHRSNLWTFPSLYYSVKYTFGASNSPTTSVQFVLIDTIQLCGNCIDVGGSDIISWIFHKKLVPDHPDDPEVANKQWAWIENELATSTADYLFVGGHYPVYSICEHGPNTCLINRLDPLLRKYDVSAYFSGHDHDLQLLQHTNTTDGTTMTYIVSGASSRSDRSSKNIKNVPEGSLLFRYPTGWNPFSQLGFSNGGFINVNLTRESANFIFYNGEAQNKYQRTIKPRNLNRN